MTPLDLVLNEQMAVIRALAPRLESLATEGPEEELYRTLVEVKRATCCALNMMARNYE